MNTRRLPVLLGLVVAVACALVPGDVHAQAAGTRAGRPQQPGRLLELAQNVEPIRDVVYAQPDGHELRLDLFLDRHRAKQPTVRYPVVVWIHGGGWRQGSKERCPAVGLVAGGYAVVSINYRLTDVATFPAQIHDCKAAIRWLRAHADKYQLDGDRIAVWGASAGGHLAALLGTSKGVKELEGELGHNDQRSDVQAVIDWFGPTDFALLAALPFINDDNPVSQLLGGPVNQKAPLARLASPVTHVNGDEPPFLIMHGSDDKLVHPRQSQVLHTALQEAKVDSALHVIVGAGHGGPQFTTESAPIIQAFLERVLAKKAEN